MRRLTTFLVIILLFIPLLALNFTVKAQEEEWQIETAGPNYDIFFNTADPIQKMFVSAPQRVQNSTGDWVDYIYSWNESKQCHVVQTGLIAGKIFLSGYASFWTPDLSEEIVKSEKWEEWKWDGSNWKSATLNNPISFEVTQNTTGVYIEATRSTSKPTGILTVIYHFRTGQSLKHWVYWDLEALDQTVEIKQVWDLAGSITKCKIDNVEVSESGTYNATRFLFFNETNPFMVLEDQSIMFDKLNPTSLDFAGKKVIYTFSNWTLAQGEILEIDPTTTTYYATASASGYNQYGPDDFYPPTSYSQYLNTGYAVGQVYESTYEKYTTYDGIVIIDTSPIPDDATISSATCKVSMVDDHSDTDFNVVISPGGSISTSGWTGQESVSVSPGAVSKTGNTGFSLSSSRYGTEPTGEEYVVLGGGQLEVTYSVPPPPTQYYLTVTTSHSTQTGQGWYYDYMTAYAGVVSGIVSGGTGIRYVFTYWSGDASGTNYAQSNGISMTSDKTAVANWKTQYFFDVDSAYDSPTGEGWYDSGTTTVNSTVTTPFGDYNTTGWTGTGSLESGGTTNSNTTGVFTILEYSTVQWNWVTSGGGGEENGGEGNGEEEGPPSGSGTEESDIEQILSASDPVDAAGKTVYAVTSNMFAGFLLFFMLLGVGVAYYFDSLLWVILLIVFVVLAVNFIFVFVVLPLDLIPEISFIEPFLLRLPRLELSTYALSFQAFLQLAVVGSLLVICFTPIVLVSWKRMYQ